MLQDLLANLNATRSMMLRAPTEANRLAYRVTFEAWLGRNKALNRLVAEREVLRGK